MLRVMGKTVRYGVGDVVRFTKKRIGKRPIKYTKDGPPNPIAGAVAYGEIGIVSEVINYNGGQRYYVITFLDKARTGIKYGQMIRYFKKIS